MGRNWAAAGFGIFYDNDINFCSHVLAIELQEKLPHVF